jgi:hypothetical protein
LFRDAQSISPIFGATKNFLHPVLCSKVLILALMHDEVNTLPLDIGNQRGKAVRF